MHKPYGNNLYRTQMEIPSCCGYNDEKSITLSYISFPTHPLSLMEQFFICKLNLKEMSNAVLLLENLDWL